MTTIEHLCQLNTTSLQVMTYKLLHSLPIRGLISTTVELRSSVHQRTQMQKEIMNFFSKFFGRQQHSPTRQCRRHPHQPNPHIRFSPTRLPIGTSLFTLTLSSQAFTQDRNGNIHIRPRTLRDINRVVTSLLKALNFEWRNGTAPVFEFTLTRGNR